MDIAIGDHGIILGLTLGMIDLELEESDMPYKFDIVNLDSADKKFVSKIKNNLVLI